MSWDEDLQFFGAQKELRYVTWAAEKKDDPSETTARLWGTRAGYEIWVEGDSEENPEDYVRARAEYASTNSFASWFAEQTWKPGPVKRKKRITAAECLFSYAGVTMPDKLTYRDREAQGGYRTVPLTEDTGMIGDFEREVEDQESEHQIWGADIATLRAALDAMLQETKGDRSVLIAKLATKLDPGAAKAA